MTPTSHPYDKALVIEQVTEGTEKGREGEEHNTFQYYDPQTFILFVTELSHLLLSSDHTQHKGTRHEQ